MIRYATLALIAASSLLVSDALACSRVGGPPTLQESVVAADEIFVARLVAAREKFFRADGEDEPYVEGQYRLIEALKGAPSKKGRILDFPLGPGNCSLGLMVGWDYVFMVSDTPERKNQPWVGMFSGSFPLGPYRDPADEEEPELVALRNILKTLESSKK